MFLLTRWEYSIFCSNELRFVTANTHNYRNCSTNRHSDRSTKSCYLMSFQTIHTFISLHRAHSRFLSQKCNSLHKLRRNNPMIKMIVIQCFCHQIKSHRLWKQELRCDCHPTVLVKKEEIGVCCLLFIVHCNSIWINKVLCFQSISKYN